MLRDALDGAHVVALRREGKTLEVRLCVVFKLQTRHDHGRCIIIVVVVYHNHGRAVGGSVPAANRCRLRAVCRGVVDHVIYGRVGRWRLGGVVVGGVERLGRRGRL